MHQPYTILGENAEIPSLFIFMIVQELPRTNVGTGVDRSFMAHQSYQQT